MLSFQSQERPLRPSKNGARTIRDIAIPALLLYVRFVFKFRTWETYFLNKVKITNNNSYFLKSKMSFANLSNASFNNGSIFGKRSIVGANGKEISLTHIYKSRVDNTNVQILTPQEIKPSVSGDKDIHFRFIQINDP
jgi:hypothetical protein